VRTKVIELLKKAYPGWESMQDWDRDISEAVDPELNPVMEDVPNEFEGTIHVKILYERPVTTIDLLRRVIHLTSATTGQADRQEMIAFLDQLEDKS
jgi:hypothetical protein